MSPFLGFMLKNSKTVRTLPLRQLNVEVENKEMYKCLNENILRIEDATGQKFKFIQSLKRSKNPGDCAFCAEGIKKNLDFMKHDEEIPYAAMEIAMFALDMTIHFTQIITL